MNLNVNATLDSDKLQHPIMLPLSECTDVEIDDNIHSTCFRELSLCFQLRILVVRLDICIR